MIKHHMKLMHQISKWHKYLYTAFGVVLNVAVVFNKGQLTLNTLHHDKLRSSLHWKRMHNLVLYFTNACNE